MRGRTLSYALVIVDEKSNGLVYTIEKMKPFDITSHVPI
ncbi:PhoH family protein [Clostridium estertheticum]|nr:PhoH family protein [Clostridium estertheticum]WAG56731.1 PhoH family protein [Clostridium estertheticum]